MNRFVKNNMLLIAVFVISGVAAVALMIYALIEYVQMAQQIGKIDELRSQIETIGKQTPRPVDENKPRLEADIKLYEKSAADLRSHFGRPMQPAVDAFIKAIQPDRKPAAKKEGEDAPEEPEELTEESFMAKFKEGWGNIQPTQYAQQNYFLESKFRPNYPKWRKGTAAFAELAKNHTFEKITDNNVDEILLSAMGIDRRLQGRPDELQRIFNEFRERTNEMLEGKIDLTEQANRFGFPSDSAGAYAKADYPILLAHMNIIYDMLQRLKAPKDPKDTKEPTLKIIHDIRIRNTAGNPDNGDAGVEGGGGMPGDTPSKWAGSIESAGDFSSYHYTLVVSGPMEAIRDVAIKLANAYKDRRVYIVRSVFLYAEENRAAMLFAPTEVNEPENNAGVEQPAVVAQPTGRRRGRRAQQVVIDQPTQTQDNDAAAKKKREEAERMKAYLEKQKTLPFHERDGYGEILVGGDKDFRAVIDIDYVVLNRP